MRSKSTRSYDKTSNLERLRALMMRRRKFRAPLPVDTHVLYSAVLGEEQERAMNVLLADGKLAFNLSSTLEVRFPRDVSSLYVEPGVFKCKAALATPMPNLRVLIHHEHPVYNMLRDWALLWEAAHKDVNDACETLRLIQDLVRSPAELLRVWPAMGKFFYPHVKRPSLVRSRMKLVMSRVMAHEELLLSMTRTEELLAECLMLPTDDGKEWAYLD